MTYFHMLFEPHEGLPGNHVAGGADSLPPFMDGSLPLLLRATCEAGPGLRLVGLLNALDSRSSPHAFATGPAHHGDLSWVLPGSPHLGLGGPQELVPPCRQ